MVFFSLSISFFSIQLSHYRRKIISSLTKLIDVFYSIGIEFNPMNSVHEVDIWIKDENNTSFIAFIAHIHKYTTTNKYVVVFFGIWRENLRKKGEKCFCFPMQVCILCVFLAFILLICISILIISIHKNRYLLVYWNVYACVRHIHTHKIHYFNFHCHTKKNCTGE